jgi:hypothetical protein
VVPAQGLGAVAAQGEELVLGEGVQHVRVVGVVEHPLHFLPVIFILLFNGEFIYKVNKLIKCKK